jgi:hypothetical protein
MCFDATSSQIYSHLMGGLVESGIGLSNYAGVNIILPVKDYEYSLCILKFSQFSQNGETGKIVALLL